MALSYRDIMQGWQAAREILNAHQRQLDAITAIVARIEDDNLRVALMTEATSAIHHPPARIIGELLYHEAFWEKEQQRLEKNRQRVAKCMARKKAGAGIATRGSGVPYGGGLPSSSYYENIARALHESEAAPPFPLEDSPRPAKRFDLHEVPTEAPGAKGKLEF